VTLAIISDSHIPEREESIPQPFQKRIADAEHTIHAGDFETPEVLADVADLATELTAVHGNVDPADVGLPAVAELTIEDVTFVVTHGTLNPVRAAVYGDDGLVMSPVDWKNAIADTARTRTRSWDGDGIIGIGGHTHQVEDVLHEGVRLLNPGSVTGADPADEATMMTVEVEGDSIDVTLHEA